jgi:hypothetical protein
LKAMITSLEGQVSKECFWLSDALIYKQKCHNVMKLN